MVSYAIWQNNTIGHIFIFDDIIQRVLLHVCKWTEKLREHDSVIFCVIFHDDNFIFVGKAKYAFFSFSYFYIALHNVRARRFANLKYEVIPYFNILFLEFSLHSIMYKYKIKNPEISNGFYVGILPLCVITRFQSITVSISINVACMSSSGYLLT